MKVLRSTMYPPPGHGEPITTVADEHNLRLGVAETIEELSSGLNPPVFVAFEIFTVPDGTSLESCTLEADRRQEENAERECNQAIAYYWYAGVLAQCKENGTVSATERAPLNVNELSEVARALAKHPIYRQGQTVRQIADDGRVVKLAGGEVTIED
jgi:hypothetical protein